MRFVEEEHKFRLVEISHFREPVKKLGQEPEQEGRVQCAVIHEALGIQYVDHAFSVCPDCQEITDIESRLEEEAVSPFRFDGDDRTDDRSDRR